MAIKHYTNRKTGGLQKVREGSRLHKLVAKSEHYSEISKAKADALLKASDKTDEKSAAKTDEK